MTEFGERLDRKLDEQVVAINRIEVGLGILTRLAEEARKVDNNISITHRHVERMAVRLARMESKVDQLVVRGEQPGLIAEANRVTIENEEPFPFPPTRIERLKRQARADMERINEEGFEGRREIPEVRAAPPPEGGRVEVIEGRMVTVGEAEVFEQRVREEQARRRTEDFSRRHKGMSFDEVVGLKPRGEYEPVESEVYDSRERFSGEVTFEAPVSEETIRVLTGQRQRFDLSEQEAEDRPSLVEEGVVREKLVKVKEAVKEQGVVVVEEQTRPELKVWECKIGYVGSRELPQGSDLPMRKAVIAAYEELVGRGPEFCFSGWGGKLTESEQAVVEDREPEQDGGDHA